MQIANMFSANFSFLGRIDGGSILTRFSQDIQLIDMSLPLALQVVVGSETAYHFCVTKIADVFQIRLYALDRWA